MIGDICFSRFSLLLMSISHLLPTCWRYVTMAQSSNLILKNHPVDICILPVVRWKTSANVCFFEEPFHGYVQRLVQCYESISLQGALPRFDSSAYTEFGKLMDGWETRRKRIPGACKLAQKHHMMQQSLVPCHSPACVWCPHLPSVTSFAVTIQPATHSTSLGFSSRRIGR